MEDQEKKEAEKRKFKFKFKCIFANISIYVYTYFVVVKEIISKEIHLNTLFSLYFSISQLLDIKQKRKSGLLPCESIEKFMEVSN